MVAAAEHSARPVRRSRRCRLCAALGVVSAVAIAVVLSGDRNRQDTATLSRKHSDANSLAFVQPSSAGTRLCSLKSSSRLRRHLRHAASSDDMDGEGSDAVRFLPPMDFALDELEPAEGAQVMPCFPLGAAYMPEGEETLNIFEPRYRQMYSDILFSGGRRFMVPTLTQDDAGGVRLSEVAVVFYLKDLQEVSEQTNDQVKYVCQHNVIGRVRLKKVLNPSAFADRSSYLRIECEDMVDTDADSDTSESETGLVESLKQVALLQEKAGAPIKFRPEKMDVMNATRGAPFWAVARLWQGYLMERIKLRRQEFEQAVRAKIIEHFQELGEQIPQQFSLQDMPASVQQEVVLLQKGFQEEAEPLMEAQSSAAQLLVQCESHSERLELLGDMIGGEQRRMEAASALKSIFSDSD